VRFVLSHPEMTHFIEVANEQFSLESERLHSITTQFNVIDPDLIFVSTILEMDFWI
jgi:hypothetical protein